MRPVLVVGFMIVDFDRAVTIIPMLTTNYTGLRCRIEEIMLIINCF